MVTLKDIAEKADVSIMTVSKVLHDAPDISTETKARVSALAQQMGYVPNTMARSLRSRTTKLFGLAIPTITHPGFIRLVLALEEKAFDAGYDLLITHTLGLPEREEAVIRRLLARRVDGIFIAPVYRFGNSAPAYREIQTRQVPTVILGHRAPFCSQFCGVETDELTASIKLTQHLIGLGHRRIAFFAGPSLSPIAQERMEGYRHALRDAGLELDDRLIFEAGMTIEEGEKTAAAMLQESTQATAVLAVNDLVAIGAINAFTKAGRHVPNDLSVAGFGNFMVGEYFKVPLTTTSQPKYRLGTAAFEAMLNLLAGQVPGSKRLPSEPLVRQSVAAPPL
ncbi:MAG: LacI family DNA-binding transcriptional regulator [Verrucomicrobiota bacterium]